MFEFASVFVRRGLAAVLAVSATAATLLAAGAAQAAVPATSVLEGTLNSTGGGPAADGNYAITFSLYKDATDPQAIWSEGPAQVAVKNGQFIYVLGSTTPLQPTLLAGGAWLTFKIGTDPELARKALSSNVFALRAAVAENVECSGCIGIGAIDPKGLAAYPKKSDLAGVALSGAYADLSGLPNMAGFAKTADLSAVATSGSYTDLKDKPIAAILGKSCGTGLVVAGLKADGSLDCTAGGAAGSLPADGINEISNNLIFNEFVDKFESPKQPIDIPDNYPLGVGDEIVVGDIGLAKKLSISLSLVNSDISTIKVLLYDPNNTQYVLYDKSGKKGDGIITTFPDNTKPVSGDLTTWVGKNPKGKWTLQVTDSAFLNNVTDGQVQKWSVNIETLSSKKIQIKGDLILDGNITIGGSATVAGLNQLAAWPTLRYRVFSTYDQNSGWIGNDNPAFFLGVNPSTWGDNNGVAWSINPDKSLWRSFFTGSMKIFPNLNVCSEMWRTYSSTNSKHVAVLFRVKNSTAADITWKPSFFHTAYAGWGNRSSITVNGGSNWQYTSDCGSNCTAAPSLTIPKNRVSSVIFMISSGPSSGDSSTTTLIFYNNTLTLPAGLAYVDDLDSATGGWEQ